MIDGFPSGNVKQSWPCEKETSKPLSLFFTQVVVATRPVVPVSGTSPNLVVRMVKHHLVNAQLLKV